jgi:hypothetical protein
MTVADDIRKSSAIAGITFGAVAALTPRLFAGLYGMSDDPNTRAMTRLWGTRTAVIATAILLAEGHGEQRRLMMMASGMSAADTILIAGASGVPARARAMGALTSAGFAAAGAYALTQ